MSESMSPWVSSTKCTCWSNLMAVVLAGNVYAVMRKYSNDAWLKISIFLMILHQAIAFAIYFLPLAFIWEKLIGVHTKPFWVRVICRLPLCKSPSTNSTPGLELELAVGRLQCLI